MTRTMAETFYRKHREEPFFEALVSQMISGTSLVLALCSKDAVRVGELSSRLQLIYEFLEFIFAVSCAKPIRA